MVLLCSCFLFRPLISGSDEVASRTDNKIVKEILWQKVLKTIYISHVLLPVSTFMPKKKHFRFLGKKATRFG
jgi:hypothetical protein